MNKGFKYTLITDGSSDKALMNVINWSLNSLYPEIPFNGVYADFHNIPNPPRTLREKVSRAAAYYPFDILFIHRDSEDTGKEVIDQRIQEIAHQLDDGMEKVTICIIPVKMMETWLLIDQAAIKKAAGNRNYRGNLDLPPVNRLEIEQEPKQFLHDLLKEASGLQGRRLRKFNPHEHVHLVAEFIIDFSLLRQLNAFQVFEQNVKKIIDEVSVLHK